MRVTIDQEFCESAGECRRLAPDVFITDLSGATQTIDRPVPVELEEDVRLAADSCPRLAIMLDSCVRTDRRGRVRAPTNTRLVTPPWP